MEVFKKLKPELVWKYFEEITKVPRPSKKEEKIIEYLLEFGAKHKLKTKRDKIGNVVISKPGTKGMESCKTVVLQSHMDMVCEKNSDVKFDFDNDPIQPYIDGEWVKAKGTTLGADDGIGGLYRSHKHCRHDNAEVLWCGWCGECGGGEEGGVYDR